MGDGGGGKQSSGPRDKKTKIISNVFDNNF